MTKTRKTQVKAETILRPKQVPYRKPATNESRVFNIRMLQDRWDMCLEDVMALLEKHRPRIFGYKAKVNYDNSVDEENVMVNEIDILTIEKKENLSHKKLKPKKVFLPQLN